MRIAWIWVGILIGWLLWWYIRPRLRDGGGSVDLQWYPDIEGEQAQELRPDHEISADMTGEYTRRIFALGDSLTAGYQLLPEESYPAQLERLLQEAWYRWRVINAGRSGDTSAQVRDRLERSLADAQPGDIVILTVGGNDGLQWLSVSQLETNIRDIVRALQEQQLEIIIGGMLLPPNYGVTYTEEFAAVYPRVAEEFGVQIIPFLLERVAAQPEFNLPDGIHPNATGQYMIAEDVFTFILSTIPRDE